MITPEQYSEAGTEHAHQAALFLRAQQSLDKHPELALMFAIPNGGARSGATAARLKAEGVKAGVPDICLPVARRGFYGLFIEMKRPGTKWKAKGRTGDAQLQWHAKLAQQGYCVRVCFTFEEAWLVLMHYLGGRS